MVLSCTLLKFYEGNLQLGDVLLGTEIVKDDLKGEQDGKSETVHIHLLKTPDPTSSLNVIPGRLPRRKLGECGCESQG